MDSDTQDNFSSSDSWIPIKALRKLMGFNHTQVTVPQIPENEDLPNKSINTSTSFAKLHQKYTKTLPKSNSHSNIRTEHPDQFIKILEQKLQLSDNKVKILENKLKMSQLENNELSKLLQKQKKEHMIKLQTMQEQHERKLQKSKGDLNCLLKEMNNRSNMIILEDFIQIHLAEMEKCRSTYEDTFKSFLKQVNRRESEGTEYFDSISQKLEMKFEDELNGLKDRYDIQIEKLKECVSYETLEDFEDELSTRINSERVTCELKGSLLENSQKIQYKSPKSSFYHN